MTRRRLWLLTTVTCAALSLPTVIRLVGVVGPVGAWQDWLRRRPSDSCPKPRPGASCRQRRPGRRRPGRSAHSVAGATVLTPEAIGHWRSAVPTAIEVFALVLAVGGLAIVLIDRRRDRRRATTPARVRRLGRRGKVPSVIARRTGLAQDAVRQLLRPQPAPELGQFADVLAASLDPAFSPPVGFRRDR